LTNVLKMGFVVELKQGVVAAVKSCKNREHTCARGSSNEGAGRPAQAEMSQAASGDAEGWYTSGYTRVGRKAVLVR
jgi:hypothetical protein